MIGRRAPVPETSRRRRRPGISLPVLSSLLLASPAPAAVPALTVTADAALRFGAFVVPSSGSRTVSASGAVVNDGIFPLASTPVGPSQFTVAYDRGNQNGKPITVTFQMMLSSVPTVTQTGVSGRLSAFDSDLPGAALLVPGRVVTYTIANCTTRICAKSFRVGARLDVTRSSGGANLTIALPVIATLLSVEGN